MTVHRAMRACTMLTLVLSLVAGCAPSAPPAPALATSTSYDDLVALFDDWREFESPPAVDGAHDYSAAAMAAQQDELRTFEARLAAIDRSSWPVTRQIDHILVRAEMNGLDFDHRVRRPWARNPAFYVTIFPSQSDVPAHEGPVAHGWIDLWTYEYPLAADAAAELAARIGTIPAVLAGARSSLIEDARDLWMGGIRAMAGQRRDLEAFATRVAGTSPELDTAIERAIASTIEFHAWLEAELPSKTGPSGVGKEHYTWYLQNVHLLPYTWEEQVTLMRHELWRAHAALRLEEHRNRDLPPLEPIATEADYDRRFNDSVTTFVRFLDAGPFMAPREYADPALRAKIGRFASAGPDGLRGFFNEVSYRDPLAMRTHSYHWIELARMANEPHESPIRRVASLSNIFAARSEGLATAMEEWSMTAGLFDDNPRAREIIYIMLAQRAARALGGLMMHGGEYTIEQAAAFAAEWTPRGWMPADSETVLGEQHLYLQQPAYETSYIMGKIQLEQLMADRSLQLGDDFTIGTFMDEVAAAGVIPVSLLRWELAGRDEDVRRLTAGW